MVPIHYFLALLAVLVSLMGCTQKAPPGSRQSVAFNNTTGMVDSSPTPTPEPTQSVHGNLNPTVRPSNSEVTFLNLEDSGKDELNIVITGSDAQILLSLLEVEGKSVVEHELVSSIKTGSNLICSASVLKKAISNITNMCLLTLKSVNGELKQLSKHDDLKLDEKYAQTKLDTQIVSPYFTYDALSVGKFGRLVILGDNAKVIYNKMKVDASNLKETAEAHDRSGKKGKNVACYQETFGEDKDPSYKCQFFFNYDSGKFDEIEVLN